MIAGVEIENEPRDPDHAPLGGGAGWSVILRLPVYKI